MSIKTIYDYDIPRKCLVDYFNSLTGKIFKLLPLYEEQYFEYKNQTLNLYFESLLLELNSANKIILSEKYFLELLFNLESLSQLVGDYKKYRSQVFKCTNLCKKIVCELKGCEDNAI